MIDCTYKLGPAAKIATMPEQVEAIMDDLVGVFPGNVPGSVVSHLENFGVAFPAWLKRFSYNSIISLANTHLPGWSDVTRMIGAAHIAVIGVNDYRQLRSFDGGNPFAWNPANEAPAGHVLLLVGYDDDFRGHGQTVIVHDPLRGYDGQPWDYSFKSIQAAGFSDLTEIVGAALPYVVNSDTQPAAPPDPLAPYRTYVDAVEKALLSFPKPPA